MQLRSLGYRTDLIFHRFEGAVTDRGRYLVVRTPSNPTYRWGNFLLFGAPPGPGDFGRWTELFEKEVGKQPEVTHKVFGWDAAGDVQAEQEQGEVAPFLEAGSALTTSAVMATSTLKTPPKYSRDVKVREVTEADYAAVVNLHVLSGFEGESEADYRRFWEANMQGFGRMVRAGRGAWFGAFLGGELVADMGVFTDGELARYQAVVTPPEYRRRGICGTLLLRGRALRPPAGCTNPRHRRGRRLFRQKHLRSGWVYAAGAAGRARVGAQRKSGADDLQERFGTSRRAR